MKKILYTILAIIVTTSLVVWQFLSYQEPVRTYKYTVEPGHDVEITVGGAGDTQTIQESFYHTGITTWKAPAGVTSVKIELWGGGGAGGGLTTDYTVCRGGGGAGGQYVSSSSVPVIPGINYTIYIGAGGTGSTGNGGAGGDSTFNTNVMVAKGGAGGKSYENGGAGGVGTTAGAVGGDVVYAGGNGSDGGAVTTGGAGGGGAGTTGAGNNASGNTAGAYKSDFGGKGSDGRITNANGIVPSSVLSTISFNSNGGATPNYGYGGGGGGAAHVDTTNTTNRNGGAGAPGGARITYTNNTAYLYYSGFLSAGSTAVSPFYPQGSTSTDLILAVIVHKHASTTITTPANWTKIAEIEGGHRGSYLTADQGAVITTVFAREATSTLTGSQSFSIPSGNSAIGKMYRFIKSPGTTWEYTTSTDADNVAGTVWSVTSTAMTIQPDDMIFVVSGINSDAATFSNEYFSAIPGITFGEVTGEMLDQANTTGLDTRLVTYMARIHSGTTSTAPIVYRMTASSSDTNRPLGSTVFIVIRQTGGGSPPSVVEVPLQINNGAIRINNGKLIIN